MKKYLCMIMAILMTLSIIPATEVLAYDSNYDYSQLSDGTYAITGYSGTYNVLSMPDTYDGATISRIEDTAFHGYIISVSIVSASLPKDLKVIGEAAFYGNSELNSVLFNEGLETIGNEAFKDCGLTTVNLPSTVSSIGDLAFDNNQSLTTINVAEGNNNYCSVNNGLFDAGKTVLILYPMANSSTSFSIPYTTEKIANRAFKDNQFIKTLTVPQSVTTVEEDAFLQAQAIKDVYFLGTESEWNSITIASGNEKLTDATIHFTPCTEHTWETVEVVKSPTCTEKGEEKVRCTVCGKKQTKETDALDHDFGEWQQTTPPSCTADGEETRKCLRCEATETQPVGKLGHDYVAVVTDPTCTEKGYTTHTCSRCGDSYTDTETDALGHDFGEWQQKTPPSCTADGEETRKCSRCEVTETQPIGKLGHNYVAVVTDPTCTEKGYTTHTCSRCGDSYTDTETDALDHDFGEWQQTTPPSCTADGEETRKCSRCEVTETQPVKALGHKFDSTEFCLNGCGTKNPDYKEPEPTPTPKPTPTPEPTPTPVPQKDEIKVKTPKLISVKRLKKNKKSALVKWKKFKGVHGFEIQFSTSKKFKKSKTKTYTVKKQSKIKQKIKRLSKNKKYYFRIRAYKVVNGKKYYSEKWSNVKVLKKAK